jgi:hypothetical protein
VVFKGSDAAAKSLATGIYEGFKKLEGKTVQDRQMAYSLVPYEQLADLEKQLRTSKYTAVYLAGCLDAERT